MSDADQITKVKRRVVGHLYHLPVDRIACYPDRGGSCPAETFHPDRAVEYNRDEITVRQNGSSNATVILNRPLRAAKPWSFGFKGVCPAAFDITSDRCVPYQLSTVLKHTPSMHRKPTSMSDSTRSTGRCTPPARRTMRMNLRQRMARARAGADEEPV
jgi:hypothetical protein